MDGNETATTDEFCPEDYGFDGQPRLEFHADNFVGTLLLREIDQAHGNLGKRLSRILADYQRSMGHIPKGWGKRFGIWILSKEGVEGGTQGQ